MYPVAPVTKTLRAIEKAEARKKNDQILQKEFLRDSGFSSLRGSLESCWSLIKYSRDKKYVEIRAQSRWDF
jgi:hypothetical protein